MSQVINLMDEDDEPPEAAEPLLQGLLQDCQHRCLLCVGLGMTRATVITVKETDYVCTMYCKPDSLLAVCGRHLS